MYACVRACCGGDHVVRVVLGIKGRRGAWVERLAVQAIGFMPVQDLHSTARSSAIERQRRLPFPHGSDREPTNGRGRFYEVPCNLAVHVCVRRLLLGEAVGGVGLETVSLCRLAGFLLGRGNLGALRVH